MRTWRTWSGRWAAVLAGAALAVAPAAARACDDDDDADEHQAAQAPAQDRLQDEGGRQTYLRSLEKQGLDEDRAVCEMIEATVFRQCHESLDVSAICPSRRVDRI